MLTPTPAAPMPPDSAWRQWRNTVNTRRTLEQTEHDNPYAQGTTADTDRAATAETQARAVWLQTALEHFERRRTTEIENSRDTTTDRAVKALGVPCADCLTIAGAKDRTHKIVRDDSKRYPLWASCGAQPIDPTTTPMPTW